MNYYQLNKQRLLQYQKEYDKAHKAIIKIKQHNYYLRRKNIIKCSYKPIKNNVLLL